MGLRLPEVLIILVVLVLVFGANKIPQLGDALGKGIRNFKKASGNDGAIDVTPRPQDASSSQSSQLPHGSVTTPPAQAPSEKKA